jgi:Uma2 family endonuclease
VQPDLIFILTENEHKIKTTHSEGAPDLVVEIISPNSAQRDRIIKHKIYALHGIKEYWLVHPEKENVQILRLEKSDFQRIAGLTKEDLLKSPMLSGMVIRLTDVFLG